MALWKNLSLWRTLETGRARIRARNPRPWRGTEGRGELHMNRGVYGLHVGNVLRRRRRLCRFYGSDPQFPCSSATIRNPAELATALTGKAVEWIQESGAPRGDRYFAI